jgi:hypothetical protein
MSEKKGKERKKTSSNIVYKKESKKETSLGIYCTSGKLKPQKFNL